MPSVPAAGVLLTVPVSGSKINPLGRPDTLRVGTGQPVDETLKLPEPPTLKVAVDKVLSEGVLLEEMSLWTPLEVPAYTVRLLLGDIAMKFT